MRRLPSSLRVTYPNSEAQAIPDWLAQARELLEGRSGSAVKLSTIAREVGVHPVHLSRTFRRRFGQTMRRYLLGLRIEAARRVMIDTTRSLSRIAAESGFADHSHLTRAFRRSVGVTPTQYRRLHRDAGSGAS